MGEWQPIETAPKDGTRVLAVCAVAQYPKCNITWVDDGTWMFAPKPDKFLAAGLHGWWPTHWMPLPSPPSSEGGA